MMKYLDLDGARYIVATIQNLLDGKVSKDGSKVLSTNDYTTTEKNKLAGIAANATKVETSTTIGNLKINGTEKQIIPLMSAASSSAAGKAGLVPAPAQNKHTSFLRGDGTWVIPTNTTYSNATTSKDGLMSSEDKTKLDGVAANANNYVHPSSHAASMITQDATHRFVSDTEKTTWNGKASKSVATTSADGLMSSEDKTKLDGIATGANKYVHPTTSGNKHIPSGGSAGQVLKWSADGVAVWGTDNNTTYSNMTGATSSAAGKSGLVPAPASGKQSSFLRGDGTWAIPTNTTYSDMKGATSSVAGTHGLVPAPAAGANTKYLRGDGTWQTPPNTTYSLATSSSNGLLSSGDFTKLSKVTATEMGYLDGVTSSIQTQINAKAPTSHASSSTTYGVATSSSYGHAKVIDNLTTSSTSNGYALHAHQGYLLNNRLSDVEDIICTRFTIDATSNKYDAIIQNLNISNPIMIRINGTYYANAKGRVIANINSNVSKTWSCFGTRNESTDMKVYALQSSYIEVGDMQKINTPSAFELTINLSKHGWLSYTSSFVNFMRTDTSLFRYYTGGGATTASTTGFSTLKDIMIGVIGGYIKGTFNVEVWSQAPTKTITESPKTASVALNSIGETEYKKIF